MRNDTPSILTIGGFDPSNGAGVTSDVKTFEAIGMQAIAVQTCLTIQNEVRIDKVYWHSHQQVMEQIHILAEKHLVEWVKISVVSSVKSALDITSELHRLWPGVKIVWDPVFRSTSGYDFRAASNPKQLQELLGRLYLATPNREEILDWGGGAPESICRDMCSFGLVYLKGGHDVVHTGRDILYRANQEEKHFHPIDKAKYEKHGSGCVFGAALVGFLAKGQNLETAIKSAKSYIYHFLNSNPGLLGKHHSSDVELVINEN